MNPTLINKYKWLIISFLTVALAILFALGIAYNSKKIPFLGNKNTPKSSPNATSSATKAETLQKVQGLLDDKISSDTAKKEEKVQKLTDQLLQTAREANLITQAETNPTSSVKGVQTNVGANLDSVTNIAKERKLAMLSLLEDSPKRFINNSLPGNIIKSLPDSIQKNIESEVEIQGKLTTVNIDSNKKSDTIYLLFDSNAQSLISNSKTLHFVRLPSEIDLSSNPVLRIKGLELDNQIAVVADGAIK